MVAMAGRHDFWLLKWPLQLLSKATDQPPRWRPCDVGFSSALNGSALPSGYVPGDGGDGRRWTHGCGGREKGPDCFSVFLFRVPGVTCEDCSVISFSFRILRVFCTAADES